MSIEEIESLRRSHAMAPLSPANVDRLLSACAALTRERRAIRAVVDDLPASVGALRAALNRLRRIVR